MSEEKNKKKVVEFYPESVKDFDAAILKAFLVFMAFANMRTKSREAKADIKELLQQTLKLFVHDK